MTVPDGRKRPPRAEHAEGSEGVALGVSAAETCR